MVEGEAGQGNARRQTNMAMNVQERSVCKKGKGYMDHVRRKGWMTATAELAGRGGRRVWYTVRVHMQGIGGREWEAHEGR